MQLRVPSVRKETPRPRPTRSLLSGSEKSKSDCSESAGGSCSAAPFSKLYLFRSAADATSAAIDYSKGDVEDGVVDSPPSRGPIKTPICSPSPLKRTTSNERGSFSPAPRTEPGTSRKLNLSVVERGEHPRLEDAKPPTSQRLVVVDPRSGSDWSNYTKSESIGWRREGCNSPRAGLGGLRPSVPRGTRRVPSGDSIHSQRALRDRRLSLDSISTGSGRQYASNAHMMLPKPPTPGSKSLSASENSQGLRKLKRKHRHSLSADVCADTDSANARHYPSRRDDIFRGRAKLKALEALEAAKNNCTANTDV